MVTWPGVDPAWKPMCVHNEGCVLTGALELWQRELREAPQKGMVAVSITVCVLWLS